VRKTTFLSLMVCVAIAWAILLGPVPVGVTAETTVEDTDIFDPSPPADIAGDARALCDGRAV
jgi:hypothetical protein